MLASLVNGFTMQRKDVQNFARIVLVVPSSHTTTRKHFADSSSLFVGRILLHGTGKLDTIVKASVVPLHINLLSTGDAVSMWMVAYAIASIAAVASHRDTMVEHDVICLLANMLTSNELITPKAAAKALPSCAEMAESGSRRRPTSSPRCTQPQISGGR